MVERVRRLRTHRPDLDRTIADQDLGPKADVRPEA